MPKRRRAAFGGRAAMVLMRLLGERIAMRRYVAAQTTTGRFCGPSASSIIAALRAASRPTVGSTDHCRAARGQPTNGRLYR